MSIKQNVKEWFEEQVLKVLQEYSFVDESHLQFEIQDAKDDVWSDTVSRDDLDNLIYEVEEDERNIDDHEDRIDNLETSMEELISDIKSLEETVKAYDKIFKKLKSVDSWEVKVNPDGESRIKTVTSVAEENIDEE